MWRKIKNYIGILRHKLLLGKYNDYAENTLGYAEI